MLRGGWGHPQCWLLGGSIDVQEGGEWGTDDLTSSPPGAQQGLAVGTSAAPMPHSDAAGQDALHAASVEGEHDGWVQMVSDV